MYDIDIGHDVLLAVSSVAHGVGGPLTNGTCRDDMEDSPRGGAMLHRPIAGAGRTPQRACRARNPDVASRSS